MLGRGTLFYEAPPDYCAVGLAPEDGRTTDWLDIRALYDAHAQVVDLWFVAEEETT